jgi:flavin-dependent dehydrogenase
VYARRPAIGRVFLIGDAAGFLDPITGEGVRLGLASAQLAVRCMLAGSSAPYGGAWRRLIRRYWWSTSALLQVGRRPLLRRSLIRVVARFPSLFDLGLQLLGDGGHSPARLAIRQQSASALSAPLPVSGLDHASVVPPQSAVG